MWTIHLQTVYSRIRALVMKWNSSRDSHRKHIGFAFPFSQLGFPLYSFFVCSWIFCFHILFAWKPQTNNTQPNNCLNALSNLCFFLSFVCVCSRFGVSSVCWIKQNIIPLNIFPVTRSISPYFCCGLNFRLAVCRSRLNISRTNLIVLK